MGKFWVLLLVSMVILAACGGGTTPSDQSDTSDQTAQDSDSTNNLTASNPTADPNQVIATSAPAEGDDEVLPVPLPGTLVASATEDPEAGLIFDRIVFERSGEKDTDALSIEIVNDGTLVRDGMTSTVSPDDVLRIDTIIDELNFFGMQGNFLGPSLGTEEYRYRVRVERGGSSRMVTAQDNFMPQELKAFLGAIVGLGVQPQFDG